MNCWEVEIENEIRNRFCVRFDGSDYRWTRLWFAVSSKLHSRMCSSCSWTTSDFRKRLCCQPVHLPISYSWENIEDSKKLNWNFCLFWQITTWFLKENARNQLSAQLAQLLRNKDSLTTISKTSTEKNSANFYNNFKLKHDELKNLLNKIRKPGSHQ